ncbi:hypothetical protein [Zhihengliuella halotolerans]|uniref:hypothetical protein n=1 Tax=Zhihengliuella halotolerans TaxID=370736 RepID=UPI000C803AA6|nr:hypothetical protein [Zhihengliuella halotolerans]
MRVGVEVTTGLRTGPSNPGPPSGIFQIAGVTERGPVEQTVQVKSLGEYTNLFGDRTPYSSNTFDTARLFFEEGGADLLVSRAVGPAATKGFLNLEDSVAVPTIKVEAKHPGGYSAGLTVAVENVADLVTITISEGGEVLARFRDLATVADIVAAAAGNRHVNVTDLGSATAAPGNLPATLAATALSAGEDDRGNITATEIVSALETGGDQIAGGAVAAPGYSSDIIGGALIGYASGAGAIALLAPHADATKAEAIQAGDELASAGAGAYAGLFWPHLSIPDGSGSRVISPEGYIAAVRARAFREIGFWTAPAGDRATMQWANGTVTAVTPEVNNELGAAYVNGIVTVAGRTKLYNWTSLSTDRANFALLSARDTLNNLVRLVKTALEPFVFQTVDGRGHLLSQVESAAVSVVAPVAEAGGFFARMVGDEEIDPGYLVVVDSTNNGLDNLEENTVLVDISVRLSPVAALIKAEVVKVPLAAAL